MRSQSMHLRPLQLTNEEVLKQLVRRIVDRALEDTPEIAADFSLQQKEELVKILVKSLQDRGETLNRELTVENLKDPEFLKPLIILFSIKNTLHIEKNWSLLDEIKKLLQPKNKIEKDKESEEKDDKLKNKPELQLTPEAMQTLKEKLNQLFKEIMLELNKVGLPPKPTPKPGKKKNEDENEKENVNELDDLTRTLISFFCQDPRKGDKFAVVEEVPKYAGMSDIYPSNADDNDPIDQPARMLQRLIDNIILIINEEEIELRHHLRFHQPPQNTPTD